MANVWKRRGYQQKTDECSDNCDVRGMLHLLVCDKWCAIWSLGCDMGYAVWHQVLMSQLTDVTTVSHILKTKNLYNKIKYNMGMDFIFCEFYRCVNSSKTFINLP